MRQTLFHTGIHHTIDKRYGIVAVFLFFFVVLPAVSVAQINYSPAYFGPNANAVHDFGNARIPQKTYIALSANQFFGLGDATSNLGLVVEVPLLPSYISIKLWGAFAEYYRVSPTVNKQRQMEEGDLSGLIGGGDIYIQTRISLLKERRYLPSILLGIALKTASSNERGFGSRRYFDTPGYFFDLELGKSLFIDNAVVNELRLVGNVGFFCWETTNSRQNDAPMYGAKLILLNRLFDVESGIAGYSGWMNNGDKPLVTTSLLRFKQQNIAYTLMYKYGIRDYPYHLISAGITLSFDALTPKYKTH